VRSKRGMRKAPSINLSQDGRDELRLEDRLEQPDGLTVGGAQPGR
jgi:hypothetical protein